MNFVNAINNLLICKAVFNNSTTSVVCVYRFSVFTKFKNAWNTTCFFFYFDPAAIDDLIHLTSKSESLFQTFNSKIKNQILPWQLHEICQSAVEIENQVARTKWTGIAT